MPSILLSSKSSVALVLCLGTVVQMPRCGNVWCAVSALADLHEADDGRTAPAGAGGPTPDKSLLEAAPENIGQTSINSSEIAASGAPVQALVYKLEG